MTVYRGDASSNFEVKNIPSRYGFKALFFTNNLQVSRMYAHHLAHEKRNWKGGAVYEFNIPEPSKIIDFKDEVTHSRIFRNLIFDLHKQEVNSALITNCFDYPKLTENITILSSDIVVVFDFELINDYKLIESNVIL